MIKAQLITIGTEITSGEVINSNAAWVSRRLEERGIRVYSHFTVRDQYEEIFKALRSDLDCALVVVTGGLGPTSDDITRECMAKYFSQPLQFDNEAWAELEKTYLKRGLPLREAHKQQCHFPHGSERLKNPVGTAWGFAQHADGRDFFVLPGPPGELEGMWNLEVEPRLEHILSSHSFHWERWTCLGAPESEVAELVEAAIAGSGIEVGYRATIPYVKVKLYVDSNNPAHLTKAQDVDRALTPFVVGRGFEDLAEEVLRLWPEPVLSVADGVTETYLVNRLFTVQADLRAREIATPQLEVRVAPGRVDQPLINGISVQAKGHEFTTVVRVGDLNFSESKQLPYKLSVESDRGKRSAAEWVLWNCARALRAFSRKV